MLPKYLITLLFPFCLFPSTCFGQNVVLPTDTDLKAAYCIGVNIAVESAIDTMRKNMTLLPTEKSKEAEIWIAAHESKAVRLKQYLMPRIPYLDTTSIIFAMESGKNDISQGGKQITICMDSCKNQPNIQNNCEKDCLYAENETTLRVRSCNDITWLPY